MAEVKPGKWDSWPEHGTVTVVRSGRTSTGHPVYDVFEDGENIGYVARGRTESWRSLPSGVRYSLRGRPIHWDAKTHDGTAVYRSDQRSTAIGRLLEARRRVSL